jgi:integrase
LTGLLDPVFLVEAGWDAEGGVLSLPAGHRLLGRPVCRLAGCLNTARNPVRVCSGCADRLTAAGLSVDEAGALPPRKKLDPGGCVVPGCQRMWSTSRTGLCTAHADQQRRSLQLPMPQFLTDPRVQGLPGCGPCGVTACLRQRRTPTGSYCYAHQQAWWRARLADPAVDEQRWRRETPAVSEPGRLSLRGLPPLLVCQLLLGLQERTRTGRKTVEEHLRLVINQARRAQAANLAGVAGLRLARTQRSLVASMLTHIDRLLLDPEVEKVKDDWDLAAFGADGRARFTGISQHWLREAAKRWAAEDLPCRYGVRIGGRLRQRLGCLVRLSDSLRLRPDRGEQPTALGRADMENFLNRLAFQQSAGQLSLDGRRRVCNTVRTTLSRMRAGGLTRAGQPAAGLGEDFVITMADIPAAPEREPSRDLPAEILQQLCQHLPALDLPTATAETRVAVELLIDTGRRPEEIGGLAFDCLDRDGDGRPVLVYHNAKANRPGRRLPIGEPTAALIAGQQQRIRACYPDTPTAELKLLPARHHNRGGRDPIGVGGLAHRHRRWVSGLPVLRTADGVEFDRTRIVPYAYRHCYAQRHADAGVPVDVLRELMDHRVADTTKQYYRVGEARRREAVDRLVALQFDRHGNRIWRHAKALLDSEHARRAVGQVVVPFGVCAEPSNVAAGGHACPYRFRCVGCDHFRTDVSYLPDLQAHLDDLLRNRERLAAATDIDDWARAESTPSDEEISRIRRLIHRISGDLDALTADERVQVDQAVATLRRHRGMMLGMPQVRQPLPDIRPQRPA